VCLWGGKRRSDPVRRLQLESGDIAVWRGPARFVYHGVAALKDGHVMYHQKLREVHDQAAQKGHANRATLAVARKLVAYCWPPIAPFSPRPRPLEGGVF
jgi:hypothetical protein